MLHFYIQLVTTIKRGIALKKILLSLLLVSYYIPNSFAQQSPGKENTLVKKFYVLSHESLYWFSSAEKLLKATEWLKQVEAA